MPPRPHVYTSTRPDRADIVLTAEAMRAADQFAIETFGLPGFTLMETAGRGAADCVEKTIGPLAGMTLSVFCGKGNNGGDGLVLARVLHARGAAVRVFTLSDVEGMSEDAAHNLRLLEKLAGEEDGIELVRFENLMQVAAFRPADLHVDALLGTGLTSELREPLAGLVAWLNEQPQPTIALDVPTGLHSDTGEVLGAAVRADLTVTMGALKAGLLLNEGPGHAGRVEVVEIGIPHFALAQGVGQPGCALQATDAAIRAWLPARAHDAHKYSAGLALVVAGAPGMTGAPVMASTAAARAGAGYVICACAEPIQDILSQKMTEIVTLPLPVTDDGGIEPTRALEALAARREKAGALLVGCGLGRHPQTQAFVRALVQEAKGPVVIDADGLNALVGHTDLLKRHANGRFILTPHAGEFKRLTGDDVDLTDRVGTAQHFAREWNSVLVLKGMPSVVAAPDGTAYINATGNPALATAGTGDVLAGMCAGYLAEGLAPLQAAVCALHLGGAAADRYAAHFDPRTMMALDVLDQLPLVLKERFRAGGGVRVPQ